MSKRTSKRQMIFRGYAILAGLAARVEEHKRTFGDYPKVIYMAPADFEEYTDLPGFGRLFIRASYKGIPVIKLEESKHEVPTS